MFLRDKMGQNSGKSACVRYGFGAFMIPGPGSCSLVRRRSDCQTPPLSFVGGAAQFYPYQSCESALTKHRRRL